MSELYQALVDGRVTLDGLKAEADPEPKQRGSQNQQGAPKSGGMRRFRLNRKQDESGVSGEGIVAEGVAFSNGQCALHWLGDLSSIVLYDDMQTLESVHGHGGKTEVLWMDN